MVLGRIERGIYNQLDVRRHRELRRDLEAVEHFGRVLILQEIRRRVDPANGDPE